MHPHAVPIDHLAHVRSESARFHAVLAAADPGAPVPSCPGWTAADLVWHLTEVQLLWGTIVRDRLTDPAAAERKPERPDRYAALLDLSASAASALADALAAASDEEPVWTWCAADQTVGFIRRRQAHEALIHRLDAELTADALSPIDATLATDGVAEVIDWMYSGVPAWASHAVDGPVGRLATSDTGASWLVRLGRLSGTDPADGTVYGDEPSMVEVRSGEPSFEVVATARDLDAWLWNRPPLGSVTRSGDVAAFEELVRGGIQ